MSENFTKYTFFRLNNNSIVPVDLHTNLRQPKCCKMILRDTNKKIHSIASEITPQSVEAGIQGILVILGVYKVIFVEEGSPSESSRPVLRGSVSDEHTLDLTLLSR